MVRLENSNASEAAICSFASIQQGLNGLQATPRPWDANSGDRSTLGRKVLTRLKATGQGRRASPPRRGVTSGFAGSTVTTPSPQASSAKAQAPDSTQAAPLNPFTKAGHGR